MVTDGIVALNLPANAPKIPAELRPIIPVVKQFDTTIDAVAVSLPASCPKIPPEPVPLILPVV